MDPTDSISDQSPEEGHEAIMFHEAHEIDQYLGPSGDPEAAHELEQPLIPPPDVFDDFLHVGGHHNEALAATDLGHSPHVQAYLFLRNRMASFWSQACFQEMSGAVGDLGTFFPLLLAMSRTGSVSLPSALFFAGGVNIVTALMWNIPMAVQPMKSIAAIAISQKLTAVQVSLSGMWVGALVFALGATGLMPVLARWVPQSIVLGIQLGLGLTLAMGGINGITAKKWLVVWDGAAMALLIALALAFTTFHYPRFPAALLLVIFGFIAAGVGLGSGSPAYDVVSPVGWVAQGYNWNDAGYTLWAAALPQIPVTALNSVVSVCHLGERLFPSGGAPSTRAVATAVGVMNVLTCPFGAMPMCHGAGGLAAQYRFGARGGLSIFTLGCAKILFALLLGTLSMSVLEHFPSSVLNVLLVVSGLQLASCARNMGEEEDAFVTLLTAAVSVSLNVAYGTAAGIVLCLILHFRRKEGVRADALGEQR